MPEPRTIDLGSKSEASPLSRLSHAFVFAGQQTSPKGAEANYSYPVIHCRRHDFPLRFTMDQVVEVLAGNKTFQVHPRRYPGCFGTLPAEEFAASQITDLTLPDQIVHCTQTLLKR